MVAIQSILAFVKFLNEEWQWSLQQQLSCCQTTNKNHQEACPENARHDGGQLFVQQHLWQPQICCHEWWFWLGIVSWKTSQQKFDWRSAKHECRLTSDAIMHEIDIHKAVVQSEQCHLHCLIVPICAWFLSELCFTGFFDSTSAGFVRLQQNWNRQTFLIKSPALFAPKLCILHSSPTDRFWRPIMLAFFWSRHWCIQLDCWRASYWQALWGWFSIKSLMQDQIYMFPVVNLQLWILAMWSPWLSLLILQCWLCNHLDEKS